MDKKGTERELTSSLASEAENVLRSVIKNYPEIIFDSPFNFSKRDK